MKIDILTLFPEMFAPVTTSSIMGRAVERGIIDVRLTNIRDFSNDKHNRADDYPFGGGGGMVMMADPVFGALEAVSAEGKKIIYMSPRGRVLDGSLVEELSMLDELVILCGHYEGIDQRIIDYWEMEEISIGDYVLTGGELPAMVLLEYPQYTKPRQYRGMDVPEVLLNGNHRLIDLWRFRESLLLTKKRRPDLFDEFVKESGKLSKDERKMLEEIIKIEV